MRSRSYLLAAGLAATVALSACGDGNDPAESAASPAGTTAAAAGGKTSYPLSIKANCGTDVTVEAAPERAVAVDQGATEVLLSLGLESSMVGTSDWTDKIRPDLAAANAKVPRLADSKASYERILKEEPDFVAGSFGTSLNVEDPERRAQYAKLGVPTYLAPSACDGRTAEDGDGPRDHPLQMSTIYQEIRELASVFDVQPRGEALVQELETRLERVKATAPTGDDEVSAAFWFANTESPYMAGCCGSPGIMARTVGVKNVFDDTHTEWPQIGWETVLERDPDVLVLGDLDRKSQTGDLLADKIRFLKTNPVTKKLTAVREERFVIMNGADLNPSIRTVDGAEKLAAGIEKFGLAS